MGDRPSSKDPPREGEDKQRRPPGERLGHVVPQDPGLVDFLERLWTRGNPPDRIEVWWMLGPNKEYRRALVFYENFYPDEKPDLEQCTKLAGDILSAAQNCCDSKKRPCWFEVAILDPYQKTVPLTRPLGPLNPHQAYAGVRPDGEPAGLGEDDEEAPGIKPLTHKYLSKMVRSIERAMQQVHSVIGDTLQMQQAITLSTQSHNERLQNQSMMLFTQLQDAADRSLDREVLREREKVKTKAIGTAMKVSTNLLHGWLGDVGDDEGKAESGAQGVPASRKHPPSGEQRLIDSFLDECRDEKVSVKFFGDWRNTEELTLTDVFAGHGLLEPGIFTPQQFGTFLGIRDGLLPPEALDALLPGSGRPQAITPEQMAQAFPFLTESMAVALRQLADLRERKREKRADKAAQAPQGEPT